MPAHAAIARTRAQVFDRGYQFENAAKELARVAGKVPENFLAWQELATSALALNHAEAALTAAQNGLELMPRDNDSLRIQAVALEQMGGTKGATDLAWRAYQQHRRAERPTEMRSLCSQNFAACAIERLAVPVRSLQTRH